MSLVISFCGETYTVQDGASFTIGREGDLAVDDNPFLHRQLLLLHQRGEIWVISNVGSQLTATVSDDAGHMEAFLAPGASLPLVFGATNVSFTAGSTSYSMSILSSESAFVTVPARINDDGDTTIGAANLTPDQRRLVVALAEPRLRGDGKASVVLPSNADAAERLGWTITRFNRKLDNVCQKLERLGVRGLHGGPDKLASNRRSRLVEYSVATRLVTRTDLALLEDGSGADDADDT